MDTANFYKFYYTLGGGQSTLSVPPQASYTHSGGQNSLLRVWHGKNRFYELLQSSYMLGGGLNRLSKLLSAPYTLGGGQNRLSEHL